MPFAFGEPLRQIKGLAIVGGTAKFCHHPIMSFRETLQARRDPSPPEVSRRRVCPQAHSPTSSGNCRIVAGSHPHSGRATATVCATWEDTTRFFVASFLVLSNFYALNAEPLTPMPTQKYRLACNFGQVSALQACRDRCDDAAHQCISRCIGQSSPSCTRQCGPTHNTCVQSCFKSSGC